MNPESDPSVAEALARDCGVTITEFEAAWKVIRRHFVAHKNHTELLTYKRADLVRKEYFSYVDRQRKKGKAGGEKARRTKAAESAGSEAVAQAENESGLEISKPNTKQRQDKTKQYKTPIPPFEHVPPESSSGEGPEIKPSEPNVGAKPSRVLEERWFDYRASHDAATEMRWSEPDWQNAWHVWRRLDITQQLQAIEGIRVRAGTDDSALKSLPENYLRRRMWQREVRVEATVGAGRRKGFEGL